MIERVGVREATETQDRTKRESERERGREREGIIIIALFALSFCDSFSDEKL